MDPHVFNFQLSPMQPAVSCFVRVYLCPFWIFRFSLQTNNFYAFLQFLFHFHSHSLAHFVYLGVRNTKYRKLGSTSSSLIRWGRLVYFNFFMLVVVLVSPRFSKGRQEIEYYIRFPGCIISTDSGRRNKQSPNRQ